MKNVIVFGFFALAVASVLLSCKKNHDSSPARYPMPDSIVFERHNSRSVTLVPSGKFYKLENNALYAYPIVFIPAGTRIPKQKLADNLYNIARYLIDNFPIYLLQHPDDNAIGCPGCTGEKIIRLSVLSDTTTKSWQISTDTSRLPLALRQYIWRAGIIIDQL